MFYGGNMNMSLMNPFQMMNGCGFGNYDYSLGAQIGARLANLGTGILGMYLSGAFSKSNESGSHNATATVAEIQSQIDSLNAKNLEYQDYRDNPEKYVDKNLLDKASDDFRKATTDLSTAETNLGTVQNRFNSAEAAYNKLTAEEQADTTNQTVIAYNDAQKALETAKKNKEQAQIAYNTAKQNELNADNAYATNLKAVKEKAEASIKSTDEQITALKAKLAKAQSAALAEAGKESKNNSRYMSMNEFTSLFDTNGNLVKSPDTNYKDAANKAASIFLKDQTPENAKKFMKLYEQLSADEKKSINGLVVDKAEKLVNSQQSS